MSKYSNPFVNYTQSKELRRAKYNYMRAHGVPAFFARNARDWSINHVFECLQLKTWQPVKTVTQQ